jgi:hypothetical protein
MPVRGLITVAIAMACCVGFLPDCFAQSGEVPGVVAGDILRGRFVQDRHLEGMAVPLHAEGSFVLAPDRGLIWRGEKPFAMSTVITPQGVLQRVGDDDTLRLPAAQAPILAHFYDMLKSVLSGDWSAVERDFLIAREGDARSWKMTLTPRNKEDVLLGRIGAVVLHGQKLIGDVEIRQTNGDDETLEFLGQTISADPLNADDAALFAAAAR